MTTIINNFRVQQRICNLHGEPCTFVCLESNPHRMKFICQRCYSLYATFNIEGTTKLMGIDNFKEYLGSILNHAEDKIAQQSSIVDVRKMINDKKQEIQQKQYRILELIMKKLTQEKQSMFMELDMLERAYFSQESRFSANMEQRTQIIKYLKEFALDDQLLRLKFMISNQYGLNSFLAQIKTLQILEDQYYNRNSVAISEEIRRELNSRQSVSFLNKLQNLFRKSIQQTSSHISHLELLKPKKYHYSNQSSQRRNQSQQNIPIKSPRTSRQQSFAQLPKLVIS